MSVTLEQRIEALPPGPQEIMWYQIEKRRIEELWAPRKCTKALQHECAKPGTWGVCKELGIPQTCNARDAQLRVDIVQEIAQYTTPKPYGHIYFYSRSRQFSAVVMSWELRRYRARYANNKDVFEGPMNHVIAAFLNRCTLILREKDSTEGLDFLVSGFGSRDGYNTDEALAQVLKEKLLAWAAQQLRR